MANPSPFIFKTPGQVRFKSGRACRLSAALLVVAGLSLASCAPKEDVWGYVPNESSIGKLNKGIDNRRKVVRLLGSPSSVSTFESDTWYYISKRTSQWAFFDPKVLDQSILAIDFDKNGIVKDIRRFSLEDARKIQLVERKTISRGRELGFLEQIFGNIGRFSSQAPKLDTSGTPR